VQVDRPAFAGPVLFVLNQIRAGQTGGDVAGAIMARDRRFAGRRRCSSAHNVLISDPRGSGETRLAREVPVVRPRMTVDESPVNMGTLAQAPYPVQV
jgi:hypothetical protein